MGDEGFFVMNAANITDSFDQFNCCRSNLVLPSPVSRIQSTDNNRDYEVDSLTATDECN